MTGGWLIKACKMQLVGAKAYEPPVKPPKPQLRGAAARLIDFHAACSWRP